jgi:lysophospholipase
MTDGCSYTSDQFAAGDGLLLSRYVCRPSAASRAVVAVVHGYGEHGGRYEVLAADLAQRGLTVCVYDLRGHGRSSGRRGHIRSFTEYLDDTGLFLDGARREAAGLPLFLLGHSMGGLIAAAYAERRPVDDLAGLVLSAPFLRLAIPVPALRVQAARVVSRVAPTVDVGNPLDAAGLSHDEAVVAAYRTDPLNHSAATARWAAEVFAAQRAALSAAARLSLPLLVMLGEDDPVADPAAVRELFAAAASADKTLRLYAGFFHEIFNETGREAPVADLGGWLDAHVPEA